MKNAIILHGMPSKQGYYDPSRECQSNEHWLPWIQRQLLLHDILAQTPELPRPFEPAYKEWLKVFKQFEINKETVLIGHSCGAGFLVRWLSENNAKVGNVVLVAPWLDPKKTLKNDFFDFDIDPNLTSKTKNLTIFNSDNDDDYIQDSVKIIRNKVKNIKYRELHNYGHFCFGDMKTRVFPELLDEVLK